MSILIIQTIVSTICNYCPLFVPTICSTIVSTICSLFIRTFYTNIIQTLYEHFIQTFVLTIFMSNISSYTNILYKHIIRTYYTNILYEHYTTYTTYTTLYEHLFNYARHSFLDLSLISWFVTHLSICHSFLWSIWTIIITYVCIKWNYYNICYNKGGRVRGRRVREYTV